MKGEELMTMSLLKIRCVMGFCLLLAACGFPAWRDQALRDVAEGRWHVNPEQIPHGSAPSQTVEFYDAGGRHLGYGKVQGGSIELFNASGVRAGYGRLSR